MKYIYNYERKLEKLKEAISRDLLDVNQKILQDFENQIEIEELSLPRKLKLLNTILILARDHFKKDLDKVTKSDIKDAILKIQKRDISVWTKEGYRVIIKKFFSWLHYGDEYKTKVRIDGYPEIVRWISTTISEKDKPKVKASQILTEDEVGKLINAAGSIRDRCLISMLYESGCRIGELGILTYGSVVIGDRGFYVADIYGKTGHRTSQFVLSHNSISAWKNAHPTKKGTDPFWINNGGIAMDYGALRALILRLTKKVGIKKRVHAHLFRHSRVTHLLRSGAINESQAKIYFGWSPSSKELANYSHLVSKDANDAILASLGLTEGLKAKEPSKCSKCARVNELGSEYCICGYPLTEEGIKELEKKSLEQGKMLEKASMLFDFLESPQAEVLLKLVSKLALKQ